MQAVTFVVSPEGRDSNPGTQEAPLLTPAAARDRAREAAGGPHRIVLMPGEYFLRETLVLDHRDNGLTLEAGEGGEAVLYGGTPVTGWKQDGDTFWSADLPGVKEGTWDFRALVVNGRMPERARLPATGTFTHRSEWKGARYISGTWDPKPTLEQKTTILYNPADIPETLDIRNAEIRVYHMWNEALYGITRNDTERHAFILSSPTVHPPGAFGVQTYVIFNTREGMTEPGRWYLDRPAGRLVYWPLPDEDMTKANVIAPRLHRIIDLAGTPEKMVEGIVIRGLKLEATTTPLGARGYVFGANDYDGAIHATRTRNCVAEQLEITNAGGEGVVFRSGNRAARVSDCHIHHVGACGVEISTGDAGSELSRNHIHDVGLAYPCAVGVIANHSDLHILRNEIHEVPYCGIVCNGRNLRLEENLIYRVMQVMHDGAAIYGHMTDSVLRANMVRDVVEQGKGYGASAYYLDEQSRNCLVERNIAVGVPMPTHNHISRDLIFRDNVFMVDGDMKLSFARSANCTFENNRLFVPGKLTVSPPNAITAWRDNTIYYGAREKGDAAGVVAVTDEMPPVTAPTRRGSSAVAVRVKQPPELDGEVGVDEWPGPSFGLDRDPSRWPASGIPSHMELAYDGDNLYVAIIAGIFRMNELRKGVEWGEDDGAEISIAGKGADGAPATFVLRGFPDGTFQSVTVAGAPAEAAERLGTVVRYAVGSWNHGWRGEWAIPFSALGLTVERGLKMPFNVSVYRSEDKTWRCWEGTLGNTWDVGQGGVIEPQFPPPSRPEAHVATAPAPVVDGAVNTEEWGEPTMVFGPEQAATVWLRHDDRMLYVAFRNRQDPRIPLKKEPVWDTNHSVEVALRYGPEAPIAVLRGYLDGSFESSTAAGASAELADAVKKGSGYAVRIVSPSEWIAEWRIPLEPLGVDTGSESKLDANFTLHRVDKGNEWICWHRLTGSTWALDTNSGTLVLE